MEYGHFNYDPDIRLFRVFVCHGLFCMYQLKSVIKQLIELFTF